MSKPALIDGLSDIHLDLSKVEGTLSTILDLGNEDAPLQPTPKQLLGMLQLLADVVTPACDDLKEIIDGIGEEEIRDARQAEKALVKKMKVTDGHSLKIVQKKTKPKSAPHENLVS
jgi:hypothetical protein